MTNSQILLPAIMVAMKKAFDAGKHHLAFKNRLQTAF